MYLNGPVAVSKRVRWADAWASVNLHATRVGLSMLPDPSQASLEWDYGRVMSESASALAVQTRQSWLGQYVKIEIPTNDGTILWVGFIEQLDDERYGIDVSGPTAYGI